ncbi:hypothetical protein [Oscillibacter sp.]|uniref:plasmid mobilization protein n=1 Tax=Oscillibacter sp. TaxID=1945593 RepID=UPI002611BDB3|nr:hypothetical protein [Oscillibacter sp.]MDD3346456.1 hypothetical protein [Oscillibacter sp.]
MFEPRNRQLNIRLNEEEHRKLTEAAAMKGLGRAAYLRMLLLESWHRQVLEEAKRLKGD